MLFLIPSFPFLKITHHLPQLHLSRNRRFHHYNQTTLEKNYKHEVQHTVAHRTLYAAWHGCYCSLLLRNYLFGNVNLTVQVM